MRWFGILLIVINLLAGAGFVYLATQDWKGRQAITAMGVRHLLQLQGLPVEPPPGATDGFNAEDETPFVIEMGGGESTKTIGKKLLENYFTAAGAASAPAAPGADPAAPAPAPRVALSATTPVTNQIAEVKRVQALIKAELAKDLPPAEKVALLKGWVLYQAENYDTRVEYKKLTETTGKTPEQLKEDEAKLEAILDARFASALAKPQVTDSPLVAPPADGAPAPTDKDKLAKSAEWRGRSAR